MEAIGAKLVTMDTTPVRDTTFARWGTTLARWGTMLVRGE